jgi:hypothetical protein
MARSPTIEQLLAAERLETMRADVDEAWDLLVHAETHLQSARVIADSDHAGAYQLLYDAARKAVVADMAASGYRVTSDKPGADAAVVVYAEDALAGFAEQDSLLSFDQMRRTSNRSEHAGMTLSATQLAEDLGHAEAIVAAVRARLYL